MKKAWKWILGILIVVFIVAALVAAPFAMRSYMAVHNGANIQQQAPQGWNAGPMGRGNNRGNDGLQGRAPGKFTDRVGPMMGGGFGFQRGFGAFGFGLMFIGGLLRLIPLALFGLLLYGVYQLGKRAGLRATPAVTPVHAPAPAEAPAPHMADAPQDDQTPAA